MCVIKNRSYNNRVSSEASHAQSLRIMAYPAYEFGLMVDLYQKVLGGSSHSFSLYGKEKCQFFNVFLYHSVLMLWVAGKKSSLIFNKEEVIGINTHTHGLLH